MIFITVGTEKFPFDRLLGILHRAKEQGRIKDDVFAQTGNSAGSYPLFHCTKFYDLDEQMRMMKEADIIVAHAGIGSMLVSLGIGKIPVFFPRSSKLGEHFDDHQMELAGKVASLGKALVAFTEDDLVDKVINYKGLAAGLKTIEDDKSKNDLIAYLRKICTPVDPAQDLSR